MNFFELHGFLQGFFMRRQAWLLSGLLLAAGGFTAHAQTSTSKPVLLNVVAVDSAGKPVPDLTASDFSVFDDGSKQQIVSLRRNQSDQPKPLVILFDLMNSGESSRGAVWNAVKTSLVHLSSTGPLYLYLLVEDGSLYPVHALPDVPSAQGVADETWVRNIGPSLDAAMQKVSQIRPQDFRAASPIAAQSRFKATYVALNDMCAQMAALPGPKELLWVTYGIPSTIQFADRTWFDGAKFLRQLGERFVESDTTVYTADPGMSLQQGLLNRDSLDILTGATGGRAFSTIALERAITQIEAGSRINYSLEYQPPATNWDGKYHKLRVTVARKGVRLQTELGYYAVSGS
jgi:VWFA-related protein